MEAYVKMFLLCVFLIWRNLKLYEVKFNLLCKGEKKTFNVGNLSLKKNTCTKNMILEEVKAADGVDC